MPTHYRGTAKEVLALNTYIKFLRAGDSLGARLGRCGTLAEVTISQFGVLEVLYHLGPLRQNEIGSKILRSPGNVTLVVDNLEKRGLVTRQRAAEDRRAVVVALTPKGKKLIESLLPEHIAAIVDELSILTPAEQRRLGELCKKLGKGREV